MKIGILGTGMVGDALATRLSGLGHAVMMGARERDNAKAKAWAEQGAARRSGDFSETAVFGEVVIFAVKGDALLDAAARAGADKLDGKVVVDVTNPLVFGQGGLPHLDPDSINTVSAGERLQQALPGARVVKTLNTMTCGVMVDPQRAGSDHDVFVCGEDEDAKAVVAGLLGEMGWAAPIDLGGIEAARATEMMMPIWLRLWRKLGSADFNFKVKRPEAKR